MSATALHHAPRPLALPFRSLAPRGLETTSAPLASREARATALRAHLAAIRRPGLLLRAACHGLTSYPRERMLRRLIGASEPMAPGAPCARLIAAEDAQEAARRANTPDYCPKTHVELLIALIAEARLLATTGAPAGP